MPFGDGRGPIWANYGRSGGYGRGFGYGRGLGYGRGSAAGGILIWIQLMKKNI
jgi:hypothetical protein